MIDLINAIVRRAIAQITPPPEIGTITEAGLQLDGFAHPIPDWEQRGNVTYEPGTRVLVIPLKGGDRFWVDGPAVKRGVNG